MGIDKVLTFAEFFKEIGIWTWNLNLMLRIEDHFDRNYIDYDLAKLCTLVKLVGYNHRRDEGFLHLIEESINMRVTHSLKSNK